MQENKSNKIKKVWYYDLEQLINFHSAYFISKDGKDERCFVIYNDINDLEEYYEFLSTEVRGLMGFNNLNYDYPLMHYMLTEIKDQTHLHELPDEFNMLMYEKSGSIISSEYSQVRQWEVLIPQLDIFRINHFDNANNRTSLKMVEFVLRWENVQDLDIDWSLHVLENDVEEILEYNRNDVLATKRLIEECEDSITLRRDIAKTYKHYGDNIDWINFSDTKLGSELLLYPLAKSLNITPRELKQLGTDRPNIVIKDIILPSIKFKSETFKELLEDFKSKIVYSTKNPFKFIKIFKGVKYEFAVGGIHGCVEAGKYYADNEYDLIDIDVASYYPNIAISNKLYPEHLGTEFYKIYKAMYDERVKAKKLAKAGTDVQYNKLLVSVYKLILNGLYGLSNNKFSYVRDSKFTLSITCNGQLLLAMLIEAIYEHVPTASVIQANTDGVTVKVKKIHRDKLMRLGTAWEKMSGLELEYCDYEGMIIRDVNNYIAIKKGELYSEQPKASFYDNFYTQHKTKGKFEVVKTKNGKVSFAKNWSFVIVQKALYNYYIYGKSVKRTIIDCDDIYDFCGVHKAKKSPKSGGLLQCIHITNANKRTKMTKTTRYYMSIDGGKLIKKDSVTGKETSIWKGFKATIFNKYEEKHISNYNIDYSYYISEVNKIINTIENNFQIKMDL